MSSEKKKRQSASVFARIVEAARGRPLYPQKYRTRHEALPLPGAQSQSPLPNCKLPNIADGAVNSASLEAMLVFVPIMAGIVQLRMQHTCTRCLFACGEGACSLLPLYEFTCWSAQSSNCGIPICTASEFMRRHSKFKCNHRVS